MQLSVIILNYNVRYFLEQCIISVQAALKGIDSEIIVVDNASSDDSCAMVRERYPNVKLIENEINYGFSKGNNIGVAQASGKYICILNPDTVVADETFKSVLNFIQSKYECGIVGVRLIDGRANFLPESKRGVPTPFVAFTKISGLHKISKVFGKYYVADLDEYDTGPVDILVGAFMVMERELYTDLGGFDENCFMYADDIDLSYRVLKLGRENYYFGETTVIHYKGESTIKDFTYVHRFREAMNYFYKKHFTVSPIFDVVMRTGAFLFSLKKAVPKIPKKRVITLHIIFSKNLAIKEVQRILGFGANISNRIGENFLVTFSSRHEVEMIFDNSEFSFSEIIMRMHKWKNDNVTYKIIPNGTKFMLGSNDSNSRGEVQVLPDSFFEPGY